MDECPRVALGHGRNRTENLRATLDLVLDKIDWATRRQVVVKPNLVMADFPAAITHRDALAVVLEAIRVRYSGPLTVAEGCAVHPTPEAFAQQDYPALATYFRVRLVDLNADASVPVTVHSSALDPLHLRLARTLVESDCRISLTVPKTHDAVLVTLAIKNMIMGTLVNRRLVDCDGRPWWQDRLGQILHGHGNGWGSDKVAMHQSYPVMNANLAALAPQVWPHLAVVDGTVAMEGAGPVHGDPVSWNVVLAGTDPLAVDATAARLMGFAVEEVGYLYHCARLGLGVADAASIEVVGNVAPHTIARTFRPHPNYIAQRQWHSTEADVLLARNRVMHQPAGRPLPYAG